MTRIKLHPAAVLPVVLLASLPAHADGNWFVGGSIGSSTIDDTIETIPVDTDSTSIRLYGGYEFNKHFAIEFGYLDFGEFTESLQIDGSPVELSAEADGFTLSVVGTLPLSDRFSLHGTVGSFFWDGDTSFNGIADDPGDTNLFLGVGANFSLTTSLSIRAEFANYELEETDAQVLSLGLAYRFN